MFWIDTLILIAGVLLLLGIASSKLSARLGVPVLVLFLILGMLAGSEGFGGIEFEDYRLAHGIGTLALAMILFDGGLGTSIASIHSSWKASLILATVGVAITAAVTGVAASLILGIGWIEGLLLGSIVGSTDAAAVFSVFRSGGIGLSKRVSTVLEVESASNDPMAIFLTIGCIEVLLGNITSPLALVNLLTMQMAIGTACGILGGWLAVEVVNRIELNAQGLYPVMVGSFCLLTFGLTARLGGSGFLAVYLAGLVIGNRDIVFKRGIRLFHDAIAWLSQILMFVVLGLLCFPSRLLNVTGSALLIGAALIFVARPLAVAVSTLPFKFNWREQFFMSWVGLKGAVPITLATFPLMLATADHALQASLIFDVVFFIVVVSAAIQGTSLTFVARWLGLERPLPAANPVTLEIHSLRHVSGEVVDYAVGANSRASGRQVKDLALPDGVVIAMIVRGDKIVPPKGSTMIFAGDHVILVMSPGIQPLVNQVFGKDSASRGTLPTRVEFPLKASVTMSELNALYGVQALSPMTLTLAEAIRDALADGDVRPGVSASFGPVSLRILEIADNGRVELVGMSIVPELIPDKPPKEETGNMTAVEK